MLPKTFFALLCLAASVPSLALEWSTTEIQLLRSTRFREPNNPNKVTKDVLTIQHADGYSLGRNFFFIDFMKSGHQELDLAGRRESPSEIYGEAYTTLSLSRLTGRSFSAGIIRDLGLEPSEKRTQILYGILEGEEIQPLHQPPFERIRFKGWKWGIHLSKVQLLAPCEPSKIVALGLNYQDHAAEFGGQVPDEPLIFMKPATSVIGPEANIVYPKMSRRVDYEAELAVVIGKTAHRVEEAKALAYVLGYTCFNDVTARDLQKKDGQFTRAKGFDTFAAMGPWIETDIGDPDNVMVEAYLNGERRQHSSTSNMVFGVRPLISFISRVMTLLPGDVIAPGTPAGIGPMRPGDVVEVKVEGIGTLRNQVMAEEGM